MHAGKAMNYRCLVPSGLAIGGFCISLLVSYHAYYYLRKKRNVKIMHRYAAAAAAAAADKKKVELELSLDQGHLDWLQERMVEFDLPSIDKAVRILLTYCQRVANETVVFEEVRCNFCKEKLKVTKKVTVDLAHDQYLDDMVSKHKLASKDKALRIIVDYAISTEDGATVFGVKRCSHVDKCPNC